METSAITAPTPMMMPSIVKAVRSLFLFRARTATLMIASKFIVVLFSFHRKVPQHFARVLAILYREIPPDTSVTELDNTVRILRDFGLMRYDNDRQIPLVVQPLEDFHHPDRGPTIERTRRLVRQNQRRIVDQRARKRDALLLSAGELIRHVSLPIPKTDVRQGRSCAAQTFGRSNTGVQHRQFDIFESGRAWHKVETLKHKADVFVADIRKAGFIDLR